MSALALALTALAAGARAAHTGGGGGADDDDSDYYTSWGGVGEASFLWFWLFLGFFSLLALLLCAASVGHYGGYHEIREAYWAPGGVWHTEVWVGEGEYHEHVHARPGVAVVDVRTAGGDGDSRPWTAGTTVGPDGYGVAPPVRRDAYVAMPGGPADYAEVMDGGDGGPGTTPYRPIRISAPGSAPGEGTALAAFRRRAEQLG